MLVQCVNVLKIVRIGCSIISFQIMYVVIGNVTRQTRWINQDGKIRTRHYAVLHAHLFSLLPTSHTPCCWFSTLVTTDCMHPAIFPQHLVPFVRSVRSHQAGARSVTVPVHVSDEVYVTFTTGRKYFANKVRRNEHLHEQWLRLMTAFVTRHFQRACIWI